MKCELKIISWDVVGVWECCSNYGLKWFESVVAVMV
jgi:hypothetical protein